jgi:hypothetical protein
MISLSWRGCRDRRTPAPQEKKTAAEAAVATSQDRGRDQCERFLAPLEDPEDRDEDADPPLERLDPEDRTPEEPEEDRDGARADDEGLEDPPDGVPRVEGERT